MVVWAVTAGTAGPSAAEEFWSITHERNDQAGRSQAGHVVTTEQRRLDFRPSDDMPAPLDQPTDACLLVSALLAAALQEGSQTLQASNLVSFQAEVRLFGPSRRAKRRTCASLPYAGSCFTAVKVDNYLKLNVSGLRV